MQEIGCSYSEDPRENRDLFMDNAFQVFYDSAGRATVAAADALEAVAARDAPQAWVAPEAPGAMSLALGERIGESRRKPQIAQ